MVRCQAFCLYLFNPVVWKDKCGQISQMFSVYIHGSNILSRWQVELEAFFGATYGANMIA